MDNNMLICPQDTNFYEARHTVEQILHTRQKMLLLLKLTVTAGESANTVKPYKQILGVYGAMTETETLKTTYSVSKSECTFGQKSVERNPGVSWSGFYIWVTC